MWRAVLLVGLLVPGIASAAPPPTSALARRVDPAVERGRDIAEQHCAGCHAVRYGRDSPDGAAPPFPEIGLRFNELSLAKRLAGISWGEHIVMPRIALTPDDREDLAAFILHFHSSRR